MRTGSDVFLFGPFELDSARRRLMRGRERVPLPDSYMDLLLLFALHAGEIISKDALAEAEWKEVEMATASAAMWYTMRPRLVAADWEVFYDTSRSDSGWVRGRRRRR